VGSEWNDLGVLTVYAVQFRFDTDPMPLDLNRTAFNQRVNAVLLQVEQLLKPPSPPPQA
jgi:hypothetical protein